MKENIIQIYKKGKIYKNEELVFEGEANYYDGEINGYGKEYLGNELVFEGEYKDYKKQDI